ncbi:leucyl aminopeptidase [Coprinopsis cinerea okayama7|uniref:Aminopeptidase n=1 Tax=Coprinopsis cinerea (strain Okayama-7 / 130 / ATCC MYA-4618 / FGSC 9003) TaxID=240176 RepID=A8NGX3_COPC7|nr:leucyl aminopeptidase [Coprinopsis cinerea okayama7\|eukprot:XP_001833622.2 leucyl aminopeptidase [Coprinopsis cinerea okayama7\
MSTPVPTTEDPSQYRLPTSVKPKHYDVVIKTDLEALSFDGVVKVDLDIVEETSSITLNSATLDLGKVSVYSDASKATQEPTGHSLDKVQERISFQLANPLPAGSKAELKIAFSGELTGSMMGYYKSSWENEGKTEHYALTQFEPTAARRAFPCWDEPLLKATFAITMVSRADTTNLSNMPAISEEVIEPNTNVSEDIRELVATAKPDDKWKVTKFETTPPMSTYIVAVANGKFAFLESSVKMPLSGKTIPMRIYATPDVIHQAQFALDVKLAALPLYETIFNVEYPLPKLDTLVAHDFDAGAMENWGLITGRTSVFLLDPERADQQSRKRVATVQSHEVAHMWFGNITTMEWWNYLYLNEGFATLMGEVIIPNRIWPDWRMDSEFISDHLNRALGLDAKLSSHPIEVDCPDANHINQIFDALSYSKAASVLRMLSNYVGEERFLKGVSLYLKKKLFANSVTHDLWEGISTATGHNITELMENWITKIGFPVLTVTEDANGITVRQDRFLETGSAEPKDNETIWNVPLFIVSAQDGGNFAVDKSVILQEREKHFPIDTSKPFKLNGGTAGVYRVLYTPERLAKIADEAAKPEGSAFDLNDRLGLVYDALALSKAGFAKVSSALTVVDKLKNETEYLVWDSIGSSLGELYSIWWEKPEVTDKILAFRRSLFAPIVEKLGYDFKDSDSRDVKLLRKLAISQAAFGRDPKVIAELRSRFDHLLKTGDDSKIPADLQGTIYSIAVKYGGVAEYDAVLGIHDKPKTPGQKIAAMTALGNAQEPELIQRTFDSIATKARDQDIMYYFSGLSGNFKTRRLLVKYFQDQYDVLYKRFEGNFTLQYLVKYSLDFLSTKEDLEAVQAFFKDKDTSKYNQSLAQTLDSIRAKIAYIERSTEDLESWLKEWESRQ